MHTVVYSVYSVLEATLYSLYFSTFSFVYFNIKENDRTNGIALMIGALLTIAFLIEVLDDT